MGIFDFFKGSGGEGKVLKSAETIKNPKAIRDDRVGAIDYVITQVKDPSKAVPALMARFEFSLEHGINDTREKEQCMAGIIAHGDDAVPFVMTHLKSTIKIAWPIKIIKALGRSDERIVECLLSVLNYSDVSFDQSQTDKNYDILCHLADYKQAGLSEKIAHFQNDPDERVRMAAADVLMEQAFEESSRFLEPLLSDVNPDNSRIRQTVIRKYLENGWKVKNPDIFQNRNIIGPVFIDQQNKLIVHQQK